MDTFIIDHPHNEASALLAIQSRPLLQDLGWSQGFWIVSDEMPVHKAVAAVGRADTDGEEWQVRPLQVRRTPGSSRKRTSDCEAFARAGSWIYVFGSHYGSKEGPLEAQRQFVARFNESLVQVRKRALRTPMEIVRPVFLLHRLINDALREAGVALIERGEEERTALIAATVERGRDKGKRWEKLVKPEDWPINIEGATFLPSGRLLLGLRYPVTAEGGPILIEVDGIDRLFSDGKYGQPQIARVITVANIGRRDRPQGVRELDQFGASIHVIAGDLDSQDDRSTVVHDHPRGGEACSGHYVVTLHDAQDSTLKGQLVRNFSNAANVEGVIVDALRGEVWYSHDDERIRLERAQLER